MNLSGELAKLTEIAAKGDVNVLIMGPTGSGKTTLARYIHESSSRRNRPFVTVNLASLYEGTLESELFGHERGSFTGADQKRSGRLEMAQGGTVFLDEIGELPLRLQARLLEFLQSKTISPIGSSREIRLDVRIIAATNRDLLRAIEVGEFRRDLFHRLRVVSMQLKPVSDQEEDLDRIVHRCLEEVCRTSGKSILKISEEVAQRFENYGWPGNFRELRNVLEYAVLSSESGEITLRDLPAWFVEPSFPILTAAEPIFPFDFYGALSQFERHFLERALRKNRGKISQTARRIGMNKTTLLRRIRFHAIDLEPFMG